MNDIRDIKPFMKLTGWDMPQGTSQSVLLNGLIIRNMDIWFRGGNLNSFQHEILSLL